jgi:hypothetical protein
MERRDGAAVVSLAEQTAGPELAAFLRWLFEPSGGDFAEVLEVLGDPSVFEEDWRAFVAEQHRASAPTIEMLDGEERADRR